MSPRPCLLACLREAEARILRRLMKVRAAQLVFAENSAQWLKTQFELEAARIARELDIPALTLRLENDRVSNGLYIHAQGSGEEEVYGPVLWHTACARASDVLSRRGVGYVLRHTDLL